ncbi:conserved hypothetical protein [Magnetococcus marinus MC-1]|uniref:Uncharacterized protein n=1 Tax=Magnetococcus marinus (strain ATCC BAA-1437 / JCM 17883 / MC-1) TaxID=156889 RepID=A0LCS1_MAGMM|nr:nitroreductase family protein [Magnetococcus marinus]ABK45764.1 conserved hypothetical protein [Magnetococcus marinus MC-1]
MTMDAIVRYHQQTKHRTDRYAASPEFMDWDTQPNPFRHYIGAPRLALPRQAMQQQRPFCHVHQPRAKAEPITPYNIAAVLGLTLGLAAWKAIPHSEQRWALRCNPSSGNLHPTEGYLVIPALGDEHMALPAGVYHYDSYGHALEQRLVVAAGQPWLRHEQPGFVVGFSSIFWREMWKYGERAYRYCQLDMGHAVAALSYAAVTMGWRVQVLDGVGDATITQLLGLPTAALQKGQPEPEHPDLLVWVSPSGVGAELVQEQVVAWAQSALRGVWQGSPNVLSPRYMHRWPIIEEVAQAAERPQRRVELAEIGLPHWPPLAAGPCTKTLSQVIYQRRSAQQFDGKTVLDQAGFYRILDALLPRPGVAPWDSQSWPVALHPLIFVHRVAGLAAGLYQLVRHPDALAELKQALSADYVWQTVEGSPEHLPLYRLMSDDLRMSAMIVSCKQAIAGDSAFSMGMLAQWQRGMQIGAWHYRNMYWEAGMLGQVLYLEAEAEGVRGTGIGCYFDDLFHERVGGLQGMAWQSLYHFTVGTPLEDVRLTTEPPYGHL